MSKTHIKSNIIFKKKNNKYYSIIISVLKNLIRNENLFYLIRPFKVYFFNGFIFFINVIYYKIKNPKYLNLPARHIFSFVILNRFLSIYKKDDIKIFLLGGTLLGSIRQKAFSGRPYDIDLGITENDYKKLKKKFSKLPKIGVSLIRTKNTNKLEKYLNKESEFSIDRIAFSIFNVKIDISVYKKIILKNKVMWLGEIEKKYKFRSNGLIFNYRDLIDLKSSNLYDKKFLIPNNSLNYLEERFGKNWKIPDSKYFFEWKN